MCRVSTSHSTMKRVILGAEHCYSCATRCLDLASVMVAEVYCAVTSPVYSIRFHTAFLRRSRVFCLHTAFLRMSTVFAFIQRSFAGPKYSACIQHSFACPKYSAFSQHEAKGWRSGHQWRNLGHGTGVSVVPPQSSALRANSAEGTWSPCVMPEVSPAGSIPPPFGHIRRDSRRSKGGGVDANGETSGMAWELRLCPPEFGP